MHLHPAIENAYKVLEGAELTREEALALVTQVKCADILDLVSLANKVRQKYAAPISPCSIINAKSGRCEQNCRFCAQSAHHDTGVTTYELLPKEEVVAAAKKAYATGVRMFGYVTSGMGYLEPSEEFQKILETLDALHEALPDMKLCVSIGILSRETAELLAKHHTWRYNMNLQTSPERYHELIASTHSIDEKIATIKHLQSFGVTNCTGGILGLGETWEDRVEMAFTVSELNVDGVPLNVLLPIKGTPLESCEGMSPADVAKAFALFRLVNPTKMIKFAAGRETVMKDFQGLLMLAGPNSLMTGGYLTTRGRSIDEDLAFIGHLNEF